MISSEHHFDCHHTTSGSALPLLPFSFREQEFLQCAFSTVVGYKERFRSPAATLEVGIIRNLRQKTEVCGKAAAQME